jgi:Cu(I)/Ag(I) efflux system periplasmic protein CusF
MKSVWIIATLSLAAACTPPAAPVPEQSSAEMTDMAAPEAPAADAHPASTGDITAIDAAAGTVTVNHGPIEAVGWPAMTMSFHAEDPAILAGLQVGDHVSFELKSAAEPGVVTAIAKQ